MRLSYNAASSKMVMSLFRGTNRNRYNRGVFAHESLDGVDLSKSGLWEGRLVDILPSSGPPDLDGVFDFLCTAADTTGLPRPERIIHTLSPAVIEEAIVVGATIKLARELLTKGVGALWWVLVLDGTIEGTKIEYPLSAPGVPHIGSLPAQSAITEFLMVLETGMLRWKRDIPPASDDEFLSYFISMSASVLREIDDSILGYLSCWGHYRSLELLSRIRDVKSLSGISFDVNSTTEWEKFPRIGALYFLADKLHLSSDRLNLPVLRELAAIRSSNPSSSDDSLCYRQSSIITNPDLPANIDFLLSQFSNPTPDRAALVLAKAAFQGGLQDAMLVDLPGSRYRKHPGYYAARTDRLLLRLFCLPTVPQASKDQLAVMLSSSTKLDYILYLRKKVKEGAVAPWWKTGFSLSREAFERIMRRKNNLAKLGLWFSRMALDVTIIDGQACVPTLVSRRLSCNENTKTGLAYWVTQLTKGQAEPQLKEGET